MAKMLHVHRLPTCTTDAELPQLFEGVGRVIGKCRLGGRNDENEVATKDPDSRSQRAGWFVTVRMQSTSGDGRRASGDP